MNIRGVYLGFIAVGGLCAYLGYRLIDTNVALEYAQGDLKRAYVEIDIVAEFQRQPCGALEGRVDGVRFYMKNGMYVADGVEFACKQEGANIYLLRKDKRGI